ncbi:hypothetical protein RFS42_001757 [Vibrio vulnificus]|nr:hypothetical protein [Vibrio vulnificus]
MSKETFLEQWLNDKPMYEAWGKFVTSKILEQLVSKGYNVSSYLKQPAIPRVKEDDSLIDKAFYRPGKEYSDPYNDIEDKVGVRFVVLLLEQIEEINSIVTSSNDWIHKECRHFENERSKDPLIFTYQSVHYVVRASRDISFEGLLIKENTPCEIQVRTLLQHAYAELTHDAIYKAKKHVRPKVHRTVAKSMALIETTDDFFSNVYESLNRGHIEEFDIERSLDSLYEHVIGKLPMPMQKSALAILYEFEDMLDADLINRIQSLITSNDDIASIIKMRSETDPFYMQSISLFVGWLIKRRRSRLISDWPLDMKIANSFAADLSVSLDDF